MTWLYVLIGLVVLVAIWVVITYNGLVRLRNKVEEAWSGIDVQLQRRADLVPNLVEAVKGYAGHERTTFEEVTRARQAVQAAQGPEQAEVADNMLTAALRNMLLIAEDYPELQASGQFLDLQRQLALLEEDISFARRFYNAVVEDLNTRTETFPSMLVAGPFGFERRPYFEAGQDERSVPQVDLGDARGGPGGSAGSPPATPVDAAPTGASPSQPTGPDAPPPPPPPTDDAPPSGGQA